METLIQVLTLLALSAIPAGFSYLLDFCLGHPGDDKVNPNAVFFRWTYWMAERRFKKSPQYTTLYQNLVLNFRDSGDPYVKNEMKENFDVSVVVSGRTMFSWEMAFGMCIFCTGVWISLFFGLWFSTLINFPGHWSLIPIVTIIFSHGICRKLKAH